MIPDSLFVLIVGVGAPILVGLLLLPTLLELRKPSDAGPRLIMPNFSSITGSQRRAMVPIVDIDERHNLSLVLIPVIADVVSVLTSVEP